MLKLNRVDGFQNTFKEDGKSPPTSSFQTIPVEDKWSCEKHCDLLQIPESSCSSAPSDRCVCHKGMLHRAQQP